MEKVRNSEWLVACDESGVGGAKYYGFGSLWMKYERRGDFIGDYNKFRQNHDYQSECKWTNANDKRAQEFIKDIIEYFFKHKWLAFQCLVVRKGAVDKSAHNGDFDLASQKHFTMLLTNKMGKIMQNNTEKDCKFRVWVDPIASCYEKADEAVEVISSNVLKQKLVDRKVEIQVITKDSKQTPMIQLCDLLLGAVMEAWQQKANNPLKLNVQQLISEHLGWQDLRADTRPEERKFNIWYFHDPTLGGREVESKSVNLKYPLPLRNT